MKYIIVPTKKYLIKYRRQRKSLVISINKAMKFSVIEYFLYALLFYFTKLNFNCLEIMINVKQF